MPAAAAAAAMASPPAPAPAENLTVSGTPEAPGTPANAESPGALSDNPSSVNTAEAPEAAPSSVQATSTSPLVTARSESQSESASAPPEPPQPERQPEPEQEPQPEPRSESQQEPKTESQPEPQLEPESAAAEPSEPQPEPPELLPERRGATVVSEYCWSSAEPGRVLLTLGRRLPDSGAICLPAGYVARHLPDRPPNSSVLEQVPTSSKSMGTLREKITKYQFITFKTPVNS